MPTIGTCEIIGLPWKRMVIFPAVVASSFLKRVSERPCTEKDAFPLLAAASAVWPGVISIDPPVAPSPTFTSKEPLLEVVVCFPVSKVTAPLDPTDVVPEDKVMPPLEGPLADTKATFLSALTTTSPGPDSELPAFTARLPAIESDCPDVAVTSPEATEFALPVNNFISPELTPLPEAIKTWPELMALPVLIFTEPPYCESLDDPTMAMEPPVL